MNSSMLEIWQDYLEVISIFNSKLEEIQADEIINTNLSLLKASIIDLQINISNFKDSLGIETKPHSSRNISNFETDSFRDASLSTACNIESLSDKPNMKFSKEELERMLALFFMYVMQIDKDSILNKSRSDNSSNSNDSNSNSTLFNTVTSAQVSVCSRPSVPFTIPGIDDVELD
jgi:hypothetical protein